MGGAGLFRYEIQGVAGGAGLGRFLPRALRSALSDPRPVTRAPKLAVMDGVSLWPAKLDAEVQAALIADVFRRAARAPFYRPVMPGSGKPFSVEETNFGPLGWISDVGGYRYAPHHPYTDEPWPPIPAMSNSRSTPGCLQDHQDRTNVLHLPKRRSST